MNQDAVSNLLLLMAGLLGVQLVFLGWMIGMSSTLMDIRKLLAEQNELLKERLPND